VKPVSYRVKSCFKGDERPANEVRRPREPDRHPVEGVEPIVSPTVSPENGRITSENPIDSPLEEIVASDSWIVSWSSSRSSS